MPIFGWGYILVPSWLRERADTGKFGWFGGIWAHFGCSGVIGVTDGPPILIPILYTSLLKLAKNQLKYCSKKLIDSFFLIIRVQETNVPYSKCFHLNTLGLSLGGPSGTPMTPEHPKTAPKRAQIPPREPRFPVSALSLIQEGREIQCQPNIRIWNIFSC